MEDAGIFYGHLAHFSRFGTLDREKSGNRVQAIVKCWQCSREKFNPDSKGGVTYKICKKIVQNCTKSAIKLYKIVQNLQKNCTKLYKICNKIVQNCTKSAIKLYKIVQNLQ
jgi:hypothetical protein